MSRVQRIRAENLTGACHVQGDASRKNRTRLHGRCVRTHHEVAIFFIFTTDAASINVERVLHLARGVIDIEIQRVEVEPLVFNFRSFGNLPSHSDEEIRNLFHDRFQGMTCTLALTRGGNSDIYSFADQDLRVMAFLKKLLTFVQCLGNARTGTSQKTTSNASIFRLQLPNSAVCLDKSSGISHKFQANCLQFIEGFGMSNS